MADINPTFQEPPGAIASFPSEEIASGLGNVVFLGITSEDDSAVDYHLITQTVYSSVSGTRRTSAGTTTIDFDTSAFNLPRTAKGTAFFSAGVGVNGADTIKLLVQLFHVDSGASETNITSEITTKNYTGTSGDTSTMMFIALPMTQKHFKKGEFLRMRVKMTTTGSNAQDLGHDPKDQNFGTIVPGTKDTTIMTLVMSFRSEL